jgi:hypothetical protein
MQIGVRAGTRTHERNTRARARFRSGGDMTPPERSAQIRKSCCGRWEGSEKGLGRAETFVS